MIFLKVTPTIRYIFFHFLFIYAFNLIAQQTRDEYNEFMYIDTILKKYKVETIKKLPVKGLIEISDEYLILDKDDESEEILRFVLTHPEFKKTENYTLEELCVKAKIALIESNCTDLRKYNDSLVVMGGGGYYSALGAKGNLFCSQIQKDSLELEKNFKLAESIFLKEKEYFQLASVYYQMGRIYTGKSTDYTIQYFSKCIEQLHKADRDDRKVINLFAAVHTYRGVIENQIGRIVNSYKDFIIGNEFAMQSKIPDKIAWVANSMGLYYGALGIYDSSKTYFERALHYNELIGDKWWISLNKINLGNTLFKTGELKQGIQLLTEGIETINEKKFEYEGIAKTALGLIYVKIDSLDKAFVLINEVIDKYTSLHGEKSSILGLPYAILAWIYAKQNHNAKARLYALNAFDLADKLGVLTKQKEVFILLYNVYYDIGEYKLAFDFLKKSNEIKDSLIGTKVYVQLLSMEKETSQQMLELEKEKANIEKEKKEVQLKNEKFRKNILYTGVFILMLLLGVIFNRLRISNRQKIIIENQKNAVETQKIIVEHKNKEITDSIIYAKRIQEAILPSRYTVAENLKNGFVLYKPKDIVSGDFYWLEKVGDILFFAAADCTGHGVPGALVSVVCSNALSKALLEENIIDPGKLLDRTSELVLQKFSKSDENVNDGMDISLCSLQFSDKKSAGLLKWAGANNPLWLIRNNEIIEFKPNKQPIGKTDNPLPFVSHQIELQKNDTVYIFSDGYQDQFGGVKGKKFKTSKLKDLFINIQNKSMFEQKSILLETFDAWKGTLEQVDDVCVIGLRV